jgi:molecular chaperone HscB
MSFFTIDYFMLFGLEKQYAQDPDTIKAGYLKLQRELHPDRFVGVNPQTKQLAVHYTAEVNQAYQTLLDPLSRAIYLLGLRGIVWDEGRSQLSPEFLMEQMEFREQVEELKEEGDEEKLSELKKIIQLKRTAIENEADYPQDIESVQKIQFFAKLMSEIDNLEDVVV